jgi:hypothetical protein
VADAFTERGFRAASIDGTQGVATRRQLLAQLGAAPDVTPEAIALGVQLRNLLTQAAAVADALVAATGEAG